VAAYLAIPAGAAAQELVIDRDYGWLERVKASRARGTTPCREADHFGQKPMTAQTDFRQLLVPVTAFAQGRRLDATLQRELNLQFPPAGELFQGVVQACHAGIAAGWMCREGDSKRRFGRIFEAAEATHGFSIDVVDITDLVGNHHRHPTGEIDMIMPVTPEAKFDGNGAGWLVYAPDTGHRPTVTAGRALILYLLPEGKIEWTDQ